MIFFFENQPPHLPSFGIVDDVLAVQKCGNEVLKINAVVNAFVETKKLKLQEKVPPNTCFKEIKQ